MNPNGAIPSEIWALVADDCAVMRTLIAHVEVQPDGPGVQYR